MAEKALRPFRFLYLHVASLRLCVLLPYLLLGHKAVLVKDPVRGQTELYSAQAWRLPEKQAQLVTQFAPAVTRPVRTATGLTPLFLPLPP